MRWVRLLPFEGFATVLLAGFLFCRKKKEYAAGLNLAIIQLIFGGISFLSLIATPPWTGKDVNETAQWLEWGVWSVVSFVTLAAAIICTAVSIASLVKAGKQK